MIGVLADVLRGISGGVVLAVLCLALGLIGAAVALLSGHVLKPLSADDVRSIAYYIGAWAFAGGLVGLARRYTVTKARTYVVYGIAGSAGMLVLTMGIESSREGWPLFALEAAAGFVLGCAAAHGVLRGRTKHRLGRELSR